MLSCCFKKDKDKLDDIQEIIDSNKPHYFYNNDEIKKFEIVGKFWVKVINIYDGDTITGLLFFNNKPFIIKIRLDMIDTPEITPKTNECTNIIQEKALAILAKEYLKYTISRNNCKLYANIKGTDKYGRCLATLYNNLDDSSSINNILVDKNLAHSYNGRNTKKPFNEYYLSIEDSKNIVHLYTNNKLIDNYLSNYLDN